MSISKKLISNTVYLFLDWFVLTIMGFFYWLIAAKLLLPYDYGVISTTINLTGVVVGVGALGLGTAAAKLIPEYSAKKQERKVSYIIKFSSKVVISVSSLLALGFLLFSPALAVIFKIPPDAVIMAGLLIFVFALSQQFGTIIYGFQRMKRFLFTDTAGQITKVVIAATLILLSFKYMGALIGILFGFLVIAILRFFSISFKGEVEKVSTKEIFYGYAIPAFVGTVAWIFFLQGQYVLLTALTARPEVTGIFTVAMLLAGVLATFPYILNQALFPLISQLSANRGTEESQKYLINSVVRYGVFITLPLAVFLILFSEQIIEIFAREEYLQPIEDGFIVPITATNLLPVLAVGSLLLAFAQIFNSTLYAIGKTKVSRNNIIATTAIFFTFVIPLILLFSAFGLAIAYVTSTLTFFLLTFFYLRKFLKLTLPLGSIKKLIPAVVATFSFLYFGLQLTQGLVVGIVLAAIAGTIYLLVLIPLKFYTQQDVKLLGFFAEKSPVFRAQIKFLENFLSRYI